MRLITVSGIPVRLHWSFLVLGGLYLIAVLFTAGLWEVVQLTMLLVALFGSVVLHELGHAMAARWFGIGTAHITLYPFGGIAAISSMPTAPRQELTIALAGPAVNFLLVAFLGLLWFATGFWFLPLLAGVNLVMGLFNLIPAFPMDGGRVLRALLATQMGWVPASFLSMRVGQVFAWLFVGLAVFSRLPGLALVGGFLLFAIAMERRRLEWIIARSRSMHRLAS